jgi:hypothetical protein
MVGATDRREVGSFALQLSSEGTAMGYKGTTKGKLIELEEPLPFADGTRVEVTVTPVPQPRKGSPQAVLQLAGTLTPAEADAMQRKPVVASIGTCGNSSRELFAGHEPLELFATS